MQRRLTQVRTSSPSSDKKGILEAFGQTGRLEIVCVGQEHRGFTIVPDTVAGALIGNNSQSFRTHIELICLSHLGPDEPSSQHV